MAKITDSTTLDGIWFGSKWNEKRSILAIPAGGAEEAGLLFLEAVDGSGDLQTGLYLWADSAGKLRYSSTRPTDEDADGAALDNTTIGGAASKALDNLASVAVNCDIVSDTDSTDDLGSSSKYWAETYTDKLYLSASSYMTAGVFDGGNWAFGVSGTGRDVTFYGDDYDLVWDCSEDELILKDNAKLVIGTGSDVEISWDETDMEIAFAAANSVVNFGQTNTSDLVLHGSTAGSDIYWDASGDVIYAKDDTHIGFGDSIDMYFNFDATDLELRQTVAGTGGFKIGVDDHGIDITIYGDTSGYDITWDASADTWTYLDSAKMAFGTSDDITFSYDGTNNELDILGSGKTILFGVDDTGIDVKWFGATSGDYMMWDESADQLLFEDATIGIAGANVTYTLGISTDELLFDGTDHANNGITFGTTGTNGTDVTFQSITSGDTIVFDAGSKTFTFADVNLVMGDEYIQFHDSNIKILSSADGQLDIDGITVWGTCLRC